MRIPRRANCASKHINSQRKREPFGKCSLHSDFGKKVVPFPPNCELVLIVVEISPLHSLWLREHPRSSEPCGGPKPSRHQLRPSTTVPTVDSRRVCQWPSQSRSWVKWNQREKTLRLRASRPALSSCVAPFHPLL